ncbi:MAG: peptidoglycan-binding protein [Pseudonocardiaceae bacterium]
MDELATARAHNAVVQRAPLTDVEKAENLKSSRYSGDATLEAAYDNSPPLMAGGGRREAVAKLQQGLVDDGFAMPISFKSGGPDGIFGKETKSTVKAFQAKHGLTEDGIVGRQTLGKLDELAGGEGPKPDKPIAPPLGPEEETRTWTPDQYIEMWERKHGRKITEAERAMLARGCIGITELNLQQGKLGPPLHLSFSTFEKAKEVRDALNRILQSKPTVDSLPTEVLGDPTLADLNNVLESFPVDPDPTQWTAVIFSKRFYSNQDPDWEKRKTPDDKAFLPDEKTGQVDMSGYRYEARPNPDEGVGATYTNFDYGWYDEETDSWWHANHAEPDMEVYQSTLEYYSRPLVDFDRQVFTVAFAKKPG